MDTSEQIKNHIAKGESEKAIKLLLEFTREERPALHDEALLLSGQYRQWKRRLTLGVEQSSGELRRIEVGVMDVLNDEETYDGNYSRVNKLASAPTAATAVAKPKSNLTPVLLGVFGTISIIFLAMLMIPVDDPAIAENPNVSHANIASTPVPTTQKEPEHIEQSERTVLGSELTESQFDQQMASLEQSTGGLDPVRFDINMVIQVRYTTGESEGFFESVNGSNEWIERSASDLDDIKARYEEVDRNNRVITLKDKEHNRRRFLSIDDDKVYEQVETFQKMHVFNIIGVY